MGRSIKAQVIALAKEDPFLTVEELARAVETTTSYVRTILSEAQLSLNEMRREYARRLEQSAGRKKQLSIAITGELRISQTKGKDVSPKVLEWVDLELFQASAAQAFGSNLGYVRLITPHSLRLVHKVSNLRDLLPAKYRKNLEVKGQRIEVCLAPAELASLLKIPKHSQVIELTTLLHCKDEPVALETKWLGAEGLVLEWSGMDSELKLSSGS